jgi:hypothetical protein
MTTKRHLLLAASIAALVSACDPARRSQIIDGMQVLAIQAEPPTARPGDAVRLEALVATRVENDAKVSLTWFACTLEFEECAEAAVPGDGVVVLGSGPVVMVEIPAQMLSGDTMLFWLDARRGGEHERSIKGVYVRPLSEPGNVNPSLDQVRWGAETPLAEVTRETRVSVRVSSSSMINEIWLESGEPASEDVQIATYVTAGELVDPSGSGASGELYFQSPEKNGRIGTWVVVNDDRGGVDWYQHWITVKGKPQ